MASFIEVGTYLVNLDFARKIQRLPDGSLLVFLDRESTSLTVNAKDAPAVLALVAPPAKTAGLKELPAKQS